MQEHKGDMVRKKHDNDIEEQSSKRRMRKYKRYRFCRLNLMGYIISFFLEIKSWPPSLFQRGKHMEEYTTWEFIFILLKIFF